ncbi:MAG TPA: alpha-glucan family phosphorylase, partial [Dermatophilaceae bacterium]
MKAIRRFSVRTVLPESISALGELASNLRWCWHPATRDLFSGIDPQRWVKVGEEPAKMLSALSAAELESLAADQAFVEKVRVAAENLATYLSRPRWYQRWAAGVEGGAPASIAYFSPEFGITEALPQYSGGLGILAGDHLKSASDLGVPVVGVGLFYKTGYFNQSLSRDGWQQETYPVLDPDDLPLALLREQDGKPCIITIDLPGSRVVRAHVWKAQVGRVPLLLLDSDVRDNDDAARGITDRLYGGTGELRLQQELLLGVGGVRALRLWSRLTGAPQPDVFHTNEGHAGFLGVERMSELTNPQAVSALTFSEALEAVRAGTVFTTHTPV